MIELAVYMKVFQLELGKGEVRAGQSEHSTLSREVGVLFRPIVIPGLKISNFSFGWRPHYLNAGGSL